MRHPKALQTKNKQIDIISRFFDPKTVEQIARDTKFVQRESPLSGMDFFLLCVFAHQKSDCISLEDMCGELVKEGIAITKQSLQDRFNEHAVEFIAALLKRALSIKLNVRQADLPSDFNRITIWDSTQISLPESFAAKYRGHGGGASIAGLKLQYGYELSTQKIIAVLIQDAVQSDHTQQLQGIEECDLRIEDLGYFNLQRLEQIGLSKAFFVSRYRFGIALFDGNNTNSNQIDLLKLERSIKAGERRTLKVFIGRTKLPVRMILEKVPEDLANKKRRKLKYDKHNKRKNLSKKRLKLCSLNIYVTNTTEQQLPSDQLRHYYSLRWQIEIIFKCWKSTYRIDQVKPMKLTRFECMHMGTLILIVITTNLMAICKAEMRIKYDKELSEFRFFKLMKSSLDLFRRAIIDSNQSLLRYIGLLEKMSLRYAVKQAKKGKMTPYNIIKFAA